MTHIQYVSDHIDTKFKLLFEILAVNYLWETAPIIEDDIAFLECITFGTSQHKDITHF